MVEQVVLLFPEVSVYQVSTRADEEEVKRRESYFLILAALSRSSLVVRSPFCDLSISPSSWLWVPVTSFIRCTFFCTSRLESSICFLRSFTCRRTLEKFEESEVKDMWRRMRIKAEEGLTCSSCFFTSASISLISLFKPLSRSAIVL